MALTRHQGQVPCIGFEKVRVDLCLFVAASHQTRLDTWSKARRPIKVGIKGRGRSGTSRDSNPAGLCCSKAHLLQCEPDKASSFTNPNVGSGHVCRVMALTRHQGLVPYIDFKKKSPRGPLYFIFASHQRTNMAQGRF